MVNRSYEAAYTMLQVNRYVLRLLAVAIVSGSISSYRSVQPSYSTPLNSSGLIASDANNAEAFYKSGLTKYNNKDYKGAIADYTKVIRINPKYTSIYTFRADAKFDSGDYKGAISDYTKAIRINPKETKAYKMRAIIKLSSGDNKGSLRDLREVAKLCQQQVDKAMCGNIQDLIRKIEG